MKPVLLLFMCFALLAGQPGSRFSQLHTLRGLWKMEKTSGVLYEHWTKSSNQLLLGKSYVVKGADTTMLETIQLKNNGETVQYIPTTAGQNNEKPVFFTLLGGKGNTYIFENREHDFPQRIIYRFVHRDSMVARIEGQVAGKERSSDFYFSRAK